MTTTFEDVADKMGKALLTHAKSIYNYAKTYSAPVYSNHLQENALKRRFHRTVERLLGQMNMLMDLAEYKGIGCFCNREMIDAYVQGTMDIISRPVAAQVVFN